MMVIVMMVGVMAIVLVERLVEMVLVFKNAVGIVKEWWW